MDHLRIASLGAAALLIVLAGSAWAAPRLRADQRPPAIGPFSGTGVHDGNAAATRAVFVVGGVELFGDWSVGLGWELPYDEWWVVPRLDLDWLNDASVDGLVARVTLGGRVGSRQQGHVSFFEGGLGVMRYGRITDRNDGSVSSTDRFAGCLELTSGIMTEPAQKPGFLAELLVSLPARNDAPSSLVARVGLRF